MNEPKQEPIQRRIRAKIHAVHRDHIHNDLGSASRYFAQKVHDRFEADDTDGIFFDMIAAVTMAAFAMEANLNYVGQATVKKWDDWDSFGKKLKKVFGALDLEPNFDERPYSSIEALKKVRDAVAHGKPRMVKFEEVAEGTHEELERRLWDRKAEWEEPITREFVAAAYQDVQAIWAELLDAAGIDPFMTLSGGSSGITFLEHLSENP